MYQLINLALVLATSLLGGNHLGTSTSTTGEKTYEVSIKQNGKTQKIEDHTVVLSPKAFDIVLNFSEPMGVLVNASFGKKTFKNAQKGKPMDKLPGFSQTAMAGGLLNQERDLFLSEDAPNFWFYDDAEHNRFNEVAKTDTGLVCVRTIEHLFDPKSQEYINITNVDQPLYLVFISYKQGAKITDRIEVQREYIEIRWGE